MKTNIKRVAWMAFVLTFANWFAAGADMSGSQRSTGTDAGSQRTTGMGGNYDTSRGKAPEEFNKASGLIGMDVDNQQGEHLGHIKDIVIDLNSEKVSYAVLSTAPKALPIDEKLLAVPLNAFTLSSDQKHLVLNADKSKVDAAAGFSSKNWPNVGNPSWGAQPFWQENDNRMNPGSPNNPLNNAPGNGGPATK